MKRDYGKLALILALATFWFACGYKIPAPATSQGDLTVTGNLAVTGTSTFTGSATFNGGTNLGGGVLTGTVDWNPDLTGSVPFDKKTCTVTGADTTMIATVQPGAQAWSDSVNYSAKVTSANTVTITALRTCGSTIDPGPAKFRVKVQP